MPATARKPVIRNVRIPEPIYEETKQAVRAGATESRSVNEFIVDSMAARLRSLRKSKIDAAIAEMKDDRDYEREVLKIEAEFGHSDQELSGL